MLIANDIYKSYGRCVALQGLSLTVETGEIFGVLGPNGAGKSTFIALACGLFAPDRGEVSITGLGSPHQAQNRRLLGVAPQEIALYGDLSAQENLALFAGLHGLAGARLRERVAWALDFVGLSQRSQARARTLSGGMARRLNLAAALVHDPMLLLLDEPTAGVDPQAKEDLLLRLEELRRSGKTILYTSHDLGDMERLCDRVAILDHGRVLTVDRVDALCTTLSRTHIIEARIGECEFQLTTDDVDQSIRELAQRGTFARLNVRRPSLHEAFLQWTRKDQKP